MIKCLRCQKETRNAKFCSRSCAAIINNSGVNRHPQKLLSCKKCSTLYYYDINNSRRLCKDCKSQQLQQHRLNIQKILQLKMRDFRNRPNQHGGPPSLAMTEVRGYNRLWNAHMLTCCQICGYSKHVELAHVKPLAKFDDEALITEVNDEENVRGLCPNCHWELDKGLIDASTIPVIRRGFSIANWIERNYDKRMRLC